MCLEGSSGICHLILTPFALTNRAPILTDVRYFSKAMTLMHIHNARTRLTIPKRCVCLRMRIIWRTDVGYQQLTVIIDGEAPYVFQGFWGLYLSNGLLMD